ncbi:MAG TPA: hypothetical protein VLH84_01275 [Patescibacteria group bacterium]|nr:hypothetical protein [Patescibacteria group bacterium]
MLHPVVISGAYRRDAPLLKRTFRELETTGCRILSPLSIDFPDPTEPVVRTEHEGGVSTDELERFHLRAIAQSEFMWLHAPDGYVGIMGSHDTGHACALNIPVFCYNALADEMLSTRIQIVPSVFAALEILAGR